MEKKYFYGSINYSSLVKARNFLADILQNARNDYEKTGVVKAFEFCYELSWKVMKKILKFHGVDVETPRDTFRESAKLNLNADAEIWFSYLEKRNITVRTCQKEILDDLFSNTAHEFLNDLDYLLKQLEKKLLVMLQMENRHWVVIQQIISKYPYRFYAYGSRTKGSARKYSDLDLCFQEKIPWNILSHIREDLENSNLPFKVDLVGWEWMSKEFREMIKEDLVLIN